MNRHWLFPLGLLLGTLILPQALSSFVQTPSAGRPSPGSRQKSVNAQDEDGKTALTKAIDNVDLDSIERLLDQGADIHHRDEFGYTPQVETGKIGGSPDVYIQLRAIVELLLSRGADINEKSLSGETVLMLTAADSTFSDSTFSNDNADSVAILLAHGADVNARNHRGETALKMATERHWTKTINILTAAGARLIRAKPAHVHSAPARTLAPLPQPRADYALLRHSISSNQEVIRLIDKTTGRTLWARQSRGFGSHSWSADHRALAISFDEIYESPAGGEFSLL